MARSHNGMTIREWLPLIGLTFAAFIFNTSEFMPIGLLTDIAADFSMTEAQAGTLITVYSWAVMALSLPLMMFASRFKLKKLLLAVIALFGVGQTLSVVAANFAMLMAARLCVACAHAVFWSVASPMAVRVVPQRCHALALSTIVTGTSVAMILGLPLGRIVGLYLGWRMTFLCVAAAAALTFAYLLVVFPPLAAGERFTPRQLPDLLRRRQLIGIYLLIFLLAAAYYTGYSYIEPFLQQTAAMGDGQITLGLTLFGATGIGGSFLFARFYDGHRLLFIKLAVVGIPLALALLLPASAFPLAVFAVCALWGMAATSYNVALQAETIKYAPPEASSVAMSIYSGIFNLGIGAGSWVGGTVCTHASISLVGLVGAAIGVPAALYCLLRLPKLLHGAPQA